MRPLDGNIPVGIREIDTNKLVAVYPNKVQGDRKEIEDKVMFWYYQQNCSNEDALRSLYVDTLTEKEIQNLKM